MTARVRLAVLAVVALAASPAAFAEPADGGGPQITGQTAYDGYHLYPALGPAPVRLAPPPAGKAQVVFYRATNMIDATPAIAVQAGGAPVAQLASGTFEVVAADPGQQVFSVGVKGRSVRVALQPGRTYFVRQTARLFSMGPHIELSSEAEFRALAPRPARTDG